MNGSFFPSQAMLNDHLCGLCKYRSTMDHLTKSILEDFVDLCQEGINFRGVS